MPKMTWSLFLSTEGKDLIDQINNVPTDSSVNTFSTGNNLLELLGLLVLLCFVLVTAYFTTRFLGQYKMKQQKDSNFQVIDMYRINQNKMLQLIKVGNKYLVIAISKDQITYITELDEAEVYIKEDTKGESQSFKQILESFRNKK